MRLHRKTGFRFRLVLDIDWSSAVTGFRQDSLDFTGLTGIHWTHWNSLDFAADPVDCATCCDAGLLSLACTTTGILDFDFRLKPPRHPEHMD